MSILYRSRFTPGLKDGSEVSFSKGDIVKYQLQSGKILVATIDSDLFTHVSAPGDRTGYMCVFEEDNERAFAVRSQIIDWDGKSPVS